MASPSTSASTPRRRRSRRPGWGGSPRGLKTKGSRASRSGGTDKAPGNGAAIGGLKVTTTDGWFAARPSGTEDVYKIYAESFRGRDHLQEVLADAQPVVDAALS